MKILFSRPVPSPDTHRRPKAPTLLCGAFFLGLAATAGHAATRTVTNTADAGPGSLRQTIAEAASGDTIKFSVTGTITLASTELDIDKNLTIQGPGPSQLALNGSGRTRIFLTEARVTLSGLAIINGKKGGGAIGGGIYNVSTGTLTLDNCLLTKNSATYGGGILNDGTLIIKNSRVLSNTGDEVGGGIYNSGILTIENSSVAGNVSNNGAGLYNEVYQPTEDDIPSAAEVVINRSRITDNHSNLTAQINSPGAGGVSNIGGKLTITHSTIDHNTAKSSVGGLFNYTNSQDNVPECTISNSTFAQNSGTSGGAILNGYGTLLVKSCTLAGNTAGNRSSTGGALVNQDSNGAQTEIGNSILAGNTGYAQPRDLFGSFVSDGYNLIQNIGNATLSGDTQHNIIGKDPLLQPLSSNGGPTPTLALSLSSPAIDQGNSQKLTTDQRGAPRPLDNPTIANASGGDGSDIGAVEVAASTPQSGSTLVVTTLEDHNDGSCSASDCSLREAIARSNVSPDANTITFRSELRGTLQLQRGQLTISQPVTITGPTQNRLRLSASSLSRLLQNTGTNVSLLHLALSQGKADNGGAILNNSNATLRLLDCTLSVNTATQTGGAIRNEGSLALINTLLSSNAAKDGGAIDNRGALLVNGSTLAANLASNLGGGIHNGGNLSLVNSTLSGNKAQGGGALYNMAGAAQVSNCTLTLNNASSSAAGIYNSSGTINVASTIIADNGGYPALDVGGTFTSQGYNLIGRSNGSTGFTGPGDLVGTVGSSLSAKLGPLQDNGGPTPTHALLAGSLAIDAGKRFGVTTDQRGVARPLDLSIANSKGSDGSDIGAFELDAPQPVLSLVVNTTDDHDDGACSLNDCTLREAINGANAAKAPRTIQFHIPQSDPGLSTNVFVIQPRKPLPDIINDKTVIDGWSQTAFGGDTNTAGPEIVLKGISQGSIGVGLRIRASNCTVQGLVINDFAGPAISIKGKTSAYNTVQGCYIGTNSLGTGLRGNSAGVIISAGAHHNLIGGSTERARNLISGNGGNVVIGTSITDNGCHDNRVQGNLIGLNRNGDAPLGGADNYGLYLTGHDNQIGGTQPAERNVIDCQSAIAITGAAATGNRVQGNYVGLDATGTKVLLNTEFGIYLQDAGHNLIGGTQPGAGNVVAGCNKVAIGVQNNNVSGGAESTSYNIIQGNFIGTDKTGTQARPNLCNGVQIINASHTLIGGTDLRARNIIAASKEGVGIFTDSDTSPFTSTANVVQGNYIGTDVSGTKALGNSDSGVFLQGTVGTVVGGTVPGAGNLISANDGVGVYVDNTSVRVPTVRRAQDNIIQGNLIGTDVDGTHPLPNGGAGIQVEGALRTVIGGAGPRAGNLVAANKNYGIFLTTDNTLTNEGFGTVLTEDTQIQGNFIGTDISGTNDLGNSNGGVLLADAQGTTIGGANSGAGNLISGNASVGLAINGVNAKNNKIFGNIIGADASGSGPLPNGNGKDDGNNNNNDYDYGFGIILLAGASNNIIGGTERGAGNLIAGNLGTGVFLFQDAKSNSIRGNSIHDNIDPLTGDSYSIALVTDSGAAGVPNDAKDGDDGPNRLQNYPVLDQVTTSPTSTPVTRLSGTLNSTPNRLFVIDFYSNPDANAEAANYLGSVTVKTDAAGDAKFQFALSGGKVGEVYTATATDSETGDTSELSAGEAASAGPAPRGTSKATTPSNGSS